MDELRVDPAALQQIVERLDRAAATATELPVPAGTPEAGPCTGAVAAVLSAYVEAYAGLADGLAYSAQGVRDSHAAYLAADQHNADLLHGSTD